MNKVTLAVAVPEGMRFALEADDASGTTFERDAMILYPYILRGQISCGRAAELLGVSRWSLVEWYGLQGLTSLEVTWPDLQDDMEALRDAGVVGRQAAVA